MRRALGIAAAGVVLTLLALAFDASPLFVPGIAFVVLAVAAPAWVWSSARPVQIRRELQADRVIEQEPVEVTIEVRRGLLSLPVAELRDPLLDAPVPLSQALSLLEGGRSARVRIVTRFARRGLHRLPEPRLSIRDPLGLSSVTKAGAAPHQELLVLPLTRRVNWTRRSAGRAVRAEGRSPAEPTAATEVDGLRPYQPGTPASRIHWPALARGAGLLERRLQPDGEARPLVVLDARAPASPEHLDAAVRAAASLTLELARAGGCRILLPGDRRTLAVERDLISWPAVHARLALVQGAPGTRPPLLDAAARTGAVIFVAARGIDRMPAVLSHPGREPVLAVLPAGLGAPAHGVPCLEVAGCRGYLLRHHTRIIEALAS